MDVMGTSLLWKPLFEAAGQTITGAIASYAVGKLSGRYYRDTSFDGPMDLWQRGIHGASVGEGDAIRFDGLVSPYTQLFPGDPFANGQRWNGLHSFPVKITSAEYQSLEFFAGSDAVLRVGSLNGESIVGLYGRYGFIGEGMIGVVSTTLLQKAIGEIFTADFVGSRAIVKGRLARCPSQHGFIAQSIALRAGIQLDWKTYKSLWYLKIDSIKRFREPSANTVSLLGSLWAATDAPRQQYLVQYGYLTNQAERASCISQLSKEKAWPHARIYCDDLAAPSEDLSFRKAFL